MSNWKDILLRSFGYTRGINLNMCSDKGSVIPAQPVKETLYTRLSKDDYYINIAAAVAKRSTCLRRHYGCVIVKNDEIISTGYNGSPRGETNCCDIGVGVCKRKQAGIEHNTGDYAECYSVHAEQNGMISASREEMMGATLYLFGEEVIEPEFTKPYTVSITAEPCPICKRMIKNAGIIRVVNRGGDVNLWD